jgi:dimeric dUTPase (all-alpha-NTP-PPase superfamily)
MTLTELLDMQRQLQQQSDAQPETLAQIRIAQMTELGEVNQAIKWGMEPVSKYPKWAWWKRAKQIPATRSNVLDELADLLCFILLEIIYRRDKGEIATHDHDAWGHEWSLAERYDDEPEFFVEAYGANALDVMCIDTSHRLEYFVGLCDCLGFSRDELEAAYKDAYDKNVARWTA